VALGAGRAKKGDPIDHAVGFLILKKVGDEVREGEPLFEIHANDEEKLKEARRRFCLHINLVRNLCLHYRCFTSKIAYSLAIFIGIRHTYLTGTR
jgi:thymidine phosphorylase